MKPLTPALRNYLASLHVATSWTGRSAFLRSNRPDLPNERTVRRWHQQFNGSWSVAPRFAIEGLGLTHLHAVVRSCDLQGLSPYVVERLWVSPDCAERAQYLHCVIPREHLQVVENALRKQHQRAEVFATSSGWERTTCLTNALPAIRNAVPCASTVLPETPLVVPAVFELWDQSLPLAEAWRRIRNRLGAKVADYLPGRRHYTVNGKVHVKAALSRLSQEGLFLQHRVHVGEPGPLEAIVTLKANEAQRFVEAVQPHAVVVSIHPGEDTSLVRLTGGAALFDAILRSGPRRVYWTDHALTATRSTPTRFAYESLFDPKAGEWHPYEVDQ